MDVNSVCSMVSQKHCYQPGDGEKLNGVVRKEATCPRSSGYQDTWHKCRGEVLAAVNGVFDNEECLVFPAIPGLVQERIDAVQLTGELPFRERWRIDFRN